MAPPDAADATSSHEDDVALLAAYAATLADGVTAALPGWVERAVAARVRQFGVPLTDSVRSAAADAGRLAADEVGAQVTALLAQDIDDQRTNPLALVRRAVRYPTAVLADAGIPPVVRDHHAEAQFPDDVYDLSPASFADLDPALHEPGLAWGAAKAHVHLRRRRSEGRS